MSDRQARLKAIIAEAEGIQAKGVLDRASATKMEELLTEGAAIRTQIEQSERLTDISGWASKSAGALPLAAKSATMETITPAGATTVERKGATVDLAEQYGEGVYGNKALQATATKDYRDAFRSYLRGGMPGLKSSELKTLQEGADTSGGFLVPEDVLNLVISRLPTPTRVAGRVTQLQTSRDALIIPRVNYSTDDLYTTGMRVTWTGEVPASATTARVTDPVFGNVRIPVYTGMMSIPLTNDMIEDASFPLVSWVSGKFGETIDLLRDNMALNGNGIGQPAGILVNPAGDANQPAVVTSGSASALTADGLIKTAFALPEQYDTNAAWVFNKTNTGLAIAQLKDSNNRYLWGAGLQDSGLVPGIRDRKLLGYDVLLSGFMPNVGASTYPAIFGDLTGYYLLNRVGFSVQVLRELYAETNQVLVLGRLRFGGLTAEPWKLKIHQAHT